MAVSGSAGSEPGLSSPRLLPVPSAWWETPAVTSRVLAAQPESASTARHFTREVLVSWGFGGLADEAETIIGELVVNAVQHGTRGTTGQGWRGSAMHGRGANGDPRARARAAWTGHLNGAGYDDAGHPDPAGSARFLPRDTGSASPGNAGALGPPRGWPRDAAQGRRRAARCCGSACCAGPARSCWPSSTPATTPPPRASPTGSGKAAAACRSWTRSAACGGGVPSRATARPSGPYCRRR